MEEERHQLDPGKPGTPLVNGHHVSSVSRTRFTSGESHDLSHGPPDADGESVGGGGEPPSELGHAAEEPGGPHDDLGGSLAQTDWETTRYLAAATQLDLNYARFVVHQIVEEPFRAVAPAAGADVVVVTRWALAALRRRAWRDGVLTGLLILKIFMPTMLRLATVLEPNIRRILIRSKLRSRPKPYSKSGSLLSYSPSTRMR